MSGFEDDINKNLNEGDVPYNPDHWDALNKKLNDLDKPSAFEQEANSILNEGSIAFNPDHFDQLSDKLNDLKTPFEQESKEILDNGSIPYAASNWNNLESEMEPSLSPFEEKAKDIFDSAAAIPTLNFDDFHEKLNESKLDAFELQAKSTLTSGAVAYDENNWKDIEKRLNKKKRRPIIWWTAAAGIILGALLINQFGKSPNTVENVKPSSNRLNTQQKNNITELTSTGQLSSSNKNNQDDDVEIIDHSKKTNNSSAFITNKNGNENKHINNLNKARVNIPEIHKETSEHRTENNDKNSNPIFNRENEELLVKNSKLGNLSEVFVDFRSANLINSQPVLTKENYTLKGKPRSNHIHPAALLWLNMWDNPSVTGMHGKHNISAVYKNDWFLSEGEESNSSKMDFIRPLHFIAAYERNIKDFSIGGYVKHQQKTNWKCNELNISGSYKKEIANQTFVRFGAGITYNSNKIDVDNLSLKEQLFDSETYNITSETTLDRFEAKNYLSYKAGGLISHPYFFLGYTANNFAQTNLSEQDKLMVTHEVISGFHIPVGDKINLSPMFKFEKELDNQYSPGLALSYNKKHYINSEYHDLKRYDVTIGTMLNNNLRIGLTLSIDEIKAKRELNLNKFTEREGYFMGGIYYSIR